MLYFDIINITGGDGPKSQPVLIRTSEDLPGPVSFLNFTDITMNSLRLVWGKPDMPNGKITGYVVTYETAAKVLFVYLSLFKSV